MLDAWIIEKIRERLEQTEARVVVEMPDVDIEQPKEEKKHEERVIILDILCHSQCTQNWLH